MTRVLDKENVLQLLFLKLQYAWPGTDWKACRFAKYSLKSVAPKFRGLRQRTR